MEPKSCFSCKHLSTWNNFSTLEEPGDAGWDCNHDEAINMEFIGNEPPGWEDAAISAFFAASCGYHQFDASVAEENQDFVLDGNDLTHKVIETEISRKVGAGKTQTKRISRIVEITQLPGEYTAFAGSLTECQDFLR